jgi:general secretion pathway protein L
MSILRIYFSAGWRDSSNSCPWALCDESGTVLQQGESAFAGMPKATECIGILAADRVLIFTAPKPPGNQRRWLAALPFIAEEHSLNEPEEIHATYANSAEPGQISVSVIAKPWLKQIISAATVAGLPLRRVIAESMMPALPADGWTLVWDGYSGFLRTSTSTALALDCGYQHTPPLALMQTLTAAGSRTPGQIELRVLPSNQADVLPAWELPVPLVPGKTWDWRDAPISEVTHNLLCGDFSPSLRLFDALSRLRPLLFILIAAFLIEVVGTHLEWIKLAGEKQELTQNIELLFRNSFGDESTLVDAPLQMQRNLAGLRHAAGVVDDADFIALLDRASPFPAKSVRSLNYESGKLELDIKLATASDFDKLEKTLKNKGLKVRSSAMHDLPDGKQAKLTITLEGLL